MNLSDEERKIIERKRAKDRAKRGAVKCYDCDGTGSYSQSDCEICDGRGELKRNGVEIQKRVRDLETRRAAMKKEIDNAIARVRGDK